MDDLHYRILKIIGQNEIFADNNNEVRKFKSIIRNYKSVPNLFQTYLIAGYFSLIVRFFSSYQVKKVTLNLTPLQS